MRLLPAPLLLLFPSIAAQTGDRYLARAKALHLGGALSEDLDR